MFSGIAQVGAWGWFD